MAADATSSASLLQLAAGNPLASTAYDNADISPEALEGLAHDAPHP